jgi:hypothetical protein
MLKPHGYVTVSHPEAKVVEYDSITCCHCQRIILVKPNTRSTVYLFPQLDGSFREEMGAGCFKCNKPICLQCCDVGTCTPIEQRLALMEAVKKQG